MLVLTRKRGEGVAIGPDIRIVVLGIKNGQVRLGIEAPRTIEVHR
ncbi:MAG: carbon storage regulator, partial [Nitrospiraceae bacterium]